MNSPHSNSFLRARRPLLATSIAILIGAATAAAQSSSTSGAGSSGSNSNSGTTGSSGYGSSSTTPSTSSSGSTSSRDNGSSAGSYNSGSSTYNSGTGSSTVSAGTSSSTGAGAMTGRDTTSTSGSKDKLSWSDRHFVTKAADDGNDEIALAKLATERATNPEVKSFAQKLVDDHTQVASELSGIASQKNVKIDKDNDKDRTYKRLSKKSGADFDQEFVEHMIDEHEKDIKMFEKAANDAKDPDVKAFASKHVDHLRSHLQQAQSLRQTVMPTGRMDKNSGRANTSSSSSTGTTGSSTSSDTYKSSSSSPSTSSSSSTPSSSSSDTSTHKSSSR